MPTQKKTKNTTAKITKAKLPAENDYAKTLASLKQQIQEAIVKAVSAVNTELILVYLEIGKTISEKEKQSGWGTKVIERLSKDLLHDFPDMKGFSSRNMRYMRDFYESYQDITILQQLVAKLPWGYNIVLMNKLKSVEERIWYAKKTIENGWSRSLLTIWIENNLYKREGKAISNFKHTLPEPQSDLAQQATKDPYIFDFINIDAKFRERELEQKSNRPCTKKLLCRISTNRLGYQIMS